MVETFHNLMWNAVEATLLAVLVAMAARWARPPAPLRHALWLVVLLKLFVPPVFVHSVGLSAVCNRVVPQLWTCAVGLTTRPYSGVTTISSEVVRPDPMGEPMQWSQDIDREVAADDEDKSNVPAEVEVGDSTPILTTVTYSAAEPTAIADLAAPDVLPESVAVTRSIVTMVSAVGVERMLIVLWITGSAGLLIVRVVQGIALARLVRSTAEAPAVVSEMCRQLAHGFGLRRVPRIGIVNQMLSPTVSVLGRPVILLPVQLVIASNAGLVRSVLAHELAHLKRNDHWLCRLELLGSLAYWWHPVFWWARHETRRAADEAADAWAVALLGSRSQYAQALLQTVEILVADRIAAPAWGPALGERDVIARRLTMIMKGPLCHRLSWPAWLAIAVLVLWVLPAAPRQVAAQDGRAAEPPATPPSEDEFKAALDLLDQDAPSATPQRGRRGEEPPRPPGAPRSPDASPGSPGVRGPGQDGRGPRDPERRLNELEEKMDRILQMLQGMQGGRSGMFPGQPPGGGGFPAGLPGAAAPRAPGVGTVPQPPGMPGGGGFGGFAPQPGLPGGGGGFGGFGAQPPGATGGAGGFGGIAPQPPPGQALGGASGFGNFFGGRGGPGMSGGARGAGQRNMADMTRNLDLGPEQRERIENMQRDIQAELQKIEAEQSHAMAEFQRRRADVERRQADMIRDLLTPDQRERLDGGRRDDRGRDTDRAREAPDQRRRPDGDRPSGDRPGEGPRRRSRDGDELPPRLPENRPSDEAAPGVRP